MPHFMYKASSVVLTEAKDETTAEKVLSQSPYWFKRTRDACARACKFPMLGWVLRVDHCRECEPVPPHVNRTFHAHPSIRLDRLRIARGHGRARWLGGRCRQASGPAADGTGRV